jgi:uncharacterized protein YdeI (BOF family)
MRRFNSKTKKLVAASGTFAMAASIGLSATAALAGYDVDNSRAAGSYSTNARYGSRVHLRRSSAPVSGTYARTVIVTRRTDYALLNPDALVTVSGTLTEDADDKNFSIRDAWGNTYAVETSNVANADATNKLVKGQIVRVHGVWRDGKLYATNVRDLGTGVALGTRVQYNSRFYTIGETVTLSGVLVSDADDDEFEIRDRNGVTTMVRTRLIPDAYGANKLQKGNLVRVTGYWIAEADGKQPQLEATSFVRM